MAGISLRQLRKSYGKTEVIHGVDCDIPDGEFVVVVGPSGCGKSTLLRTIAGLESVTEGEIKIGDQVVNHLEPAERDIAMVFQNYALYPHMTVFDNMAYGLRNRRVPKRDIQSRVREVADILEIAPLLARKPRQLSGGQRQRVAMGRAIVREPSVFLFDEPLSNLDAKLRVQMRLEIKRLHERLHITSVYVTHDQVEAMTLGQRLIVMNAGHVEQIGPPLALYQHPRTRFVADFIGSPSMNMFSASITPDGQGIRLGGETILSTDKPVDFPGRPITLGIRPEHFQLVEASQSTIQCSVDLVEELGADTLVYGHIGADATVVTVRVPGMIPVQSGDKLPLTVAPEHLHLFDADSGGRLG